jgi:116 kDa U5 small nuclear ribonucleoprotein component
MMSHAALSMLEADPEGPLMIHVTKLYNSESYTTFDALGRVMSGKVTVGQKLRVLGEGYTPDDEEDSRNETVTGCFVYESRYRIPVAEAPVGSLVLLTGVDTAIIKTATLTDMPPSDGEPVHIFRPLRFDTAAVIKVAVEPVNPTELPKMLDGLRKVSKSYPILSTKVIRYFWMQVSWHASDKLPVQCNSGRGVGRAHYAWYWRVISGLRSS